MEKCTKCGGDARLAFTYHHNGYFCESCLNLSKPIIEVSYHAVKGLRESTFGFDHSKLIWEGVRREGDRSERVIYHGEKAYRAHMEAQDNELAPDEFSEEAVTTGDVGAEIPLVRRRGKIADKKKKGELIVGDENE